MAESSTRKGGPIKKDRISVLPRNIQEIILCFLPIRDAVRTSILSKNWRHCWKTLPNLVFDRLILNRSSYDSSECHGRVLNAYKFVSVVNKVLLLHNGFILNFFLDCPLCCDAQILCDYVDQWISLFSKKGIKQLTLEGYSGGKFVAQNLSALNLTHLRLAYACLSYTPAFGGLTCLKIIELVKVDTSKQNIFDCPVLEKLSLILCKGLLPINFRAPSLKCLHHIHGYSFSECTSEYSLAGFENLTEFTFWLLYDQEMQKETSNVVKVFGSLHKIEKISIGQHSLTYLAARGSPNRFSKPMLYLKTLIIYGAMLSRSEVSCLFCLIRSAPNLGELHLSYNEYEEEENENLEDYWMEEFEDCTVHHLEIVTFNYFTGLKTELKLVKFLLANSPLLKTMSIYRGIMENDVAFKMLQEMLEFPRASSRAQIRHSENWFEVCDFGPWVARFNYRDGGDDDDCDIKDSG